MEEIFKNKNTLIAPICLEFTNCDIYEEIEKFEKFIFNIDLNSEIDKYVKDNYKEYDDEYPDDITDKQYFQIESIIANLKSKMYVAFLPDVSNYALLSTKYQTLSNWLNKIENSSTDDIIKKNILFHVDFIPVKQNDLSKKYFGGAGIPRGSELFVKAC